MKLQSVVISALFCARAAASLQKPFQHRALVKSSPNTVNEPKIDFHPSHYKSENPLQPVSVRGGGSDVSIIPIIAGTSLFFAAEIIAGFGLKRASLKFPTMLAGCLGLLFAMLSVDAVSPETASNLLNALTPSAHFWAKWMAPCFVPGLVLLPLSPSVGGPAEVRGVVHTVFN